MDKYLFVNSSLDSGGSERVMTLIANYFSEQDKEVHMVLLRDNKTRVYNLNSKIICKQFSYKKRRKLSILVSRFKQLRKYIRDNEIDYVISFMWDINLFTLIACLGLHKKVIVSERADPRRGKKSLVRSFGQNFLYLLSYKIVFQTNEVLNMFPKWIRKKGVIIHNPINENIPDYYNGERKKIIVAAGRLVEQKNFQLLINGFKDFHNIHPEYSLAIYGDGHLKKELLSLVNEYGLLNVVTLPGYVDNLNEIMKDKCMYVSTSNFEGISNVMIEALAMGVPSICTDCPVGGAALMIENNKNGLLIPVNDKELLVNSMCKIVEDKDFAKNISLEALKVRDKYSISNIGEQWISLF